MAERIIGRRRTVHFVEGSSVRREDTSAFNVWVWTQDPAALPHRLGFNLMNPKMDCDLGGGMQHLPVFHRDAPWAALEGRRSVVTIHVDVVEDLTALGRAATASSVAARGHRSIQGYDWRLGERDSGLPEKEVVRRPSPPTRNCRDGRRSSGQGRDRDGDMDGASGRSKGSRRDAARERGSGRSARSEPYPVGRASERSRVDGRRHAGGPSAAMLGLAAHRPSGPRWCSQGCLARRRVRAQALLHRRRRERRRRPGLPWRWRREGNVTAVLLSPSCWGWETRRSALQGWTWLRLLRAAGTRTWSCLHLLGSRSCC